MKVSRVLLEDNNLSHSQLTWNILEQSQGTVPTFLTTLSGVANVDLQELKQQIMSAKSAEQAFRWTLQQTQQPIPAIVEEMSKLEPDIYSAGSTIAQDSQNTPRYLETDL